MRSDVLHRNLRRGRWAAAHESGLMTATNGPHYANDAHHANDEARPAVCQPDDDRFVKVVYERVCDQMRHAEYYTRTERGVLRFAILPIDLNALLKFVADKTGLERLATPATVMSASPGDGASGGSSASPPAGVVPSQSGDSGQLDVPLPFDESVF